VNLLTHNFVYHTERQEDILSLCAGEEVTVIWILLKAINFALLRL
jgi:hypothetical protein